MINAELSEHVDRLGPVMDRVNQSLQDHVAQGGSEVSRNSIEVAHRSAQIAFTDRVKELVPIFRRLPKVVGYNV